MIFVLDVGNSNITMGLYKAEKLLYKWRMTTDITETADEFGMFFTGCFSHCNIKLTDVKSVIIGSVVPPIMYSLRHAVKKYFNMEAIVIDSYINTGMKVNIDNPSEVGADRIINAVAAYERYRTPLVLVDFGTATTYDAISDKGEYLGGIICPGIKISADALFAKASKLPHVDIVRPETVIGKGTVKAMQSGLLFGVVGQVEYLVDHMKREMGYKNTRVIATGGLARMISAETHVFDCIEAELTLEGLRVIHHKLSKM